MGLKTLCQILFLILNEHICQMYGERRLPLIVQGPIISNDINHDLSLRTKEGGVQDSEPRPIIETIDIKSKLTNRFDKTSIKCFVKNPSIRIAHEIGFEIELPFHNYKVTNMTLGIHGDNSIYKATHNEDAEILYNKLSERKQSVVMIKELQNETKTYEEAILLGMIAIIPPGEKLFITLDYEGPLMNSTRTKRTQELTSTSYNKTWNHVVHLNPHQLVQNFSVNIDIIETLPIVDVMASVVKDRWPVMEHSRSNVKYGNTSQTLHVSFYPMESSKKDGGYDMNRQFYTKYARDKNFLLRKVGQDITDIASVGEHNMMSATIMHGVDFMFSMLVLIPFIIMTEMVHAIGMIVSVFLGGNADWYLTNEMWYERELEREFDKFDKVLDQMGKLDIFKNAFDTFDHGDFDAAAFDAEFKPVPARKILVTSPSSKPNNPGNSIFVDFKQVLAATPKNGGAWTSPQSRFVIYEEPLVRKF